MKNTYIQLFSFILIAIGTSTIFKIPHFNLSEQNQINESKIENSSESVENKHEINYYYPKTEQEVAQERMNYLRTGKSLNDIAPKYRSQTLDKKANTSWESVGPFGISETCLASTPLRREDVVYSGRVISIAQDWVNTDIMYLGAASGGLWKSTDRGNTWQVILDTLPCPTVSTIATNPGKAGDVWIGTGNKGNGAGVSIGKIYHSTDFGLTWKDVTPAYYKLGYVSKISVKPAPNTSSSDIIFASTNGGLFRKEGGANFASVLTGEYYDVAFTGSLLSGSFKVVASGKISGATGSGIKFSSNNGISGSWSNRTLPSKIDSTRRITLSASLLGLHNKVYAIVTSPNYNNLEGIWRSDNGGDSWVKVGKPFNGGQMNYNNTILVDNSNGNLVWTGTNERSLFKSSDGGNSWTSSFGNQLGKIHEDEQFLWDDVSKNGTIYVLNDGGLMKSTDNGANFSFIGNSSLSISQINNLTVSPESGGLFGGGRYYVGTQDNGIQRGPDSFKQWHFVTCCDGGDIAFKDGKQYSTLIGLSSNSSYRVQSPKPVCDDGWDAFTTGLPSGTPWSSNLIYNGSHFFINLGSSVYRADNGVLPWHQLYDFGLYVNRIAVTKDNFVYVGLNDRDSFEDENFPLRQLDDNGNPTLAPTNPKGFWESKHVTDIYTSNTGTKPIFVTLTGTSGKRVVMSDNNGITFQDITGNLPDLVNARSVVADPTRQANDIIYIGSDFGVFVTTDSGVHWFKYSENLPSVCYVNDIEYDPYSNKIVAATYGRGVFIADPVAPLTSVSKNAKIPGKFELSQNYPNPFNPTTKIKYQIPESGFVSLKVYDALGKEVATLVKKNLAKGNYEVNFNAKSLASGIYIYTLKANNYSESKKMLLMK
ncbi:Glycosyl hydrolase, BNR repeat precursor [hydrothermal vent metagenome]|uniref:Glycosyl hydrolase, BNR repeat n=1 Tax=hydrothermal vent metagenome TaxID=652676 RepID=A0A3B1CH79_9ZZZZ